VAIQSGRLEVLYESLTVNLSIRVGHVALSAADRSLIFSTRTIDNKMVASIGINLHTGYGRESISGKVEFAYSSEHAVLVT
jgi:hypothetical protein